MAASEPELQKQACVIVSTMAGNEVARFSPVPPTIADLKKEIADAGHMPRALQKLVRSGNSAGICSDSDALEQADHMLILVRDETPMWSWDLKHNPCKEDLEVTGNVVTCQNMRRDFTNVLTTEPIASGRHYFEFHMHYIGDEQWCGVTADQHLAGAATAIPSKIGWMYYCGRMNGGFGGGSLADGLASLQAIGRIVKEFEKPRRSGDIIGMLVDCDSGALAFDLNGRLQGACEVPKATPLWVVTHVDTPKDHVELLKPSLQDAPPSNLAALEGALLNVSTGSELGREY